MTKPGKLLPSGQRKSATAHFAVPRTAKGRMVEFLAIVYRESGESFERMWVRFLNAEKKEKRLTNQRRGRWNKIRNVFWNSKKG